MKPASRLLAAAALGAAALLATRQAAAAGYYVGAWGYTYARYDPKLFGPERPLREVLEAAAIPLGEDGRLAGARLLVVKEERRAELWVGDRMIKAYRIQLSQHAKGAKRRRYDQRTPEGEYRICAHRASKYYRSLAIDYPNRQDAERGLAEKRIGRAQRDAIVAALDRGECPPQNTKLGSLLMLHGQQRSLTASMKKSKGKRSSPPRKDLQPGDADPGSMREYHDWTAGCIALFNPDIRELYELLPDGTPVTIVADGPVTVSRP